MERQANYVVVGMVSIALLIGAFIFVVWLANFQFNQSYDTYRVILQGPVTGLSKGGDVQFNGIKVGEITRISLDHKDANRVITDLQVEAGTPIRDDSTVQPIAQGITGVKFLQISAGSANRPMLLAVSRDRPPVIPAKRGRMDDLVNDISKLTANGAEAVVRVNRLLSDSNLGTVSSALSDVRSVTSELSSRKSMFVSLDSALVKLDRSATDLQATLASARSTMGGKDQGALSELAAASVELHGAAAEMRKLVVKLDGPVSELSSATVPGVTAAMSSIEQAAERLDNLTLEIERNPRALLTNQGGREKEIPQ